MIDGEGVGAWCGCKGAAETMSASNRGSVSEAGSRPTHPCDAFLWREDVLSEDVLRVLC